MIARIPRGFGQLFNHQIFRRIAGVAHPQVDHVIPRAPLFAQQSVDFAEQIRRQPPDPGGHVHPEGLRVIDRVFRKVLVRVHRSPGRAGRGSVQDTRRRERFEAGGRPGEG